MSFKPTIVAVLLAVGSVVFAIMVWHGPSEAGPSNVATLPEPPVDQVRRIMLQRGSGERLRFERDEAGWRQLDPFPFPMDFFSMRRLIVVASEIEVVRSLDADTMAEVGLRPPRAILSYEWPGGSLTFEFGRQSVAGRSYLKVAGDPSVLVVRGDLYKRAVLADPKEWRQRTIFPGVSVDADEIILVGAGTRTVLRRDRKQWSIVEPIRTRLDPVARDGLFTALSRAESAGFILDQPDDLAKFGLGTPVGVVEVRWSRNVERDGEVMREKLQRRLLVGSRMGLNSEDRFGIVEGQPAVVRLPEAVLRALFPPLLSLVDRTGTGVEAADVKALVIHSDQGELRLERDLERWVAPDYGTEVSADDVNALLDLLTARRAPDLDIVQQIPADYSTITLYGFGGGPLDTIRVAMPQDRPGLALENGDHVLRIFPPDTVIPLAPADFGLNITAVTSP